MALADDIAEITRQLEALVPDAALGLSLEAAEDSVEDAVPAAMQVGEPGEDGMVAWRMLPTTLAEQDVRAVEEEFEVEFPPLFRAYLLAPFHLLKSFKSKQHGQSIDLPHLPADRPLGPLRELLETWQPIIPAGYVPCGELGPGYGVLCLDTAARAMDGDCPVLFIDHEVLVSLDVEQVGQRTALAPHAERMYASWRELLSDVLA